MFKKALFAVAVAGTFAGAASAADVTLYGVVDYGFQYLNDDVTAFTPDKKNNGALYQGGDSFTMESGINAASRFGLKGTEDLGNGYTVSFNLENGFAADDGSDDLFFDREARLTIANAQFGELSFGRMGGVGSSAGHYDTTFAIADAFDGGSQYIVGMAQTGRYDNMIAYQTPKFAGLQATVQYSFKNDNSKADADNELEGHNSADRYAGFALTGEYGALQAVASYEQIMYSDTIVALHSDSSFNFGKEDTKITTVGANYDFGVAKVFGMAQYYEGLRAINGRDIEETRFLGKLNAFPEGLDGYALHIGTQAPIAAGTLTAGVYYADFEFDTVKQYAVDAVEGDFIGAAAQYNYPLSARTEVYAGIGYGLTTVEKFLKKQDHDYELETTQAFAGITHYF